MKRWWQSTVKDYFTFSKKERTSILIFLMIGVVIYFLPVFLKPKSQNYSKDAFQKELAQLEIKIDSSKNSAVYDRYKNDDDDNNYWQPDRKYYDKAKGELFVFDPNTLSADGWKRLGLRDKTIQTIQNFIGKGYKFRQPEDIRKIYGLRADEAARLIPFIKMEGNEAAVSPVNFAEAAPAFTSRAKENFTTKIVDINAADTTILIALPGIGSKLAARIINFREKLGGFSSVAQLGETYGVPDSTFQKIKVRLICSREKLRTININSADVNALKSHPYIKWNIANAIVTYRQQHGQYSSVEDLKKIDIINDEVFSKIAPYLVV